jgi:hypothetical protein
MPTIPKIAAPATTTATQFGGDVLNKIADLFNDVNIAATDSTKRPIFNTSVIFRNGKILLSDSDGSNFYSFSIPNVTADKTIALPIPTGSTDTMLLADAIQSITGKTIDHNLNTIINAPYLTPTSTSTLSNKTISAASNTITGIADANISAHTTTKITTTNKALLNSAIAYTDQANTYGDFDQILRSARLKIRNPLNSFSYLIAGGAITGSDKTLTLPAVTGNDVIVTEAFNQTLTAKTLTSPILNTPTLNGPIFSSITNTGTVTLPTSTDTLMGRATTDTMTNKTFDAATNTTPNIRVSPVIKRQGSATPNSTGTTAANVMLYDGILSSHTGTGAGTNTVTFDTTEGHIANYVTTATGNLNAGIVSPTTGIGVGRRLFGMRAVSRAKINASTTARVYFGFTSAATLPLSDTPVANADNAVIVGYSGASTNWSIFHNDGSGTATVDNVTGPIAKDALFHTIEINWAAGGNVNVIFDGVSQTISADLPATTADLFFNNVGQTTTTTARTYSIHGTFIEADK